MTWPIKRLSVHAAVLAAGLALGACNFDVINPGPIQDGFLDSTNSHPALVSGMQRNFADALDQIAYWGAALSFEINPAGSTGSYGILPNVQEGILDDQDGDDDWDRAHQARWTAEDGIRRFHRVYDADTSKTLVVAQAHVWAGYANRMLGENFCEAVFDGGSAEAFTGYFSRAETHFTQAKTIAAAVIGDAAASSSAKSAARKADSAATAGRASVRASLASYNGNNTATWAAAAGDAAYITSNAWKYAVPYSNQELNQYNFIQWGSSQAAVSGGSPYRAHTQWGTYYESLGPTGDPRVPWATTTLLGDAAVARFAAMRVPWYPQAKYTTQAAGITLSSGWEMRLIQAENELVNTQLVNAVGFMNQRRANLGLANLAPANITDAWSDLKRERMLELWLEGRRLGDLRRWAAAASPGATLDGLWVDEATGLPGGTKDGVWTRLETMTNPRARSTCWPISRTEKLTNPNITG